jgi:hypothetical protein
MVIPAPPEEWDDTFRTATTPARSMVLNGPPTQAAAPRPRRVSRRPGRHDVVPGPIRGELLGADDEAVHLAAEPEPVDIPYEQIVRGNLIDEG